MPNHSTQPLAIKCKETHKLTPLGNGFIEVQIDGKVVAESSCPSSLRDFHIYKAYATESLVVVLYGSTQSRRFSWDKDTATWSYTFTEGLF